jgi:class 3 adenylate cyclase
MRGPTFQAIVVVDIESFSRRPNPVQRELRTAMYSVVRTALEEAGLDPDQVAQEDRGDGIIVLDPSASVLLLAGRFVRELAQGLREKSKMASEVAQMRFRVALHQGLCEQDDQGWVGAAINKAARLVDAAALRASLVCADRADLAFIVSDEVYDGVIRHDYRSVDSSTFGRVVLDVKELRGEPAWIQVPGYSYPPGLPEPSAATEDDVEAAASAAGSSGAAAATSGEPAPAGQSGGFAFHNSEVHVKGDQFTGPKIVHRGGR